LLYLSVAARSVPQPPGTQRRFSVTTVCFSNKKRKNSERHPVRYGILLRLQKSGSRQVRCHGKNAMLLYNAAAIVVKFRTILK